MNDNERDTLNRLGEQLRPPHDSFDRLLTRRDRRRRSRRVTAAAVALALVAVGGTGAYLALRPSANVRIGPGDESNLPDTLRIECDGTTARVLTPKVKVRPDGVRLEVTNTASFETWTVLSLSSSSEGSPNVPAGRTETTVTAQIHPGEGDVWCGPSREDVNDDPVEGHVEIVDPDGLYKSESLDCHGTGAVSGNVDFRAGTSGEPGPPVEIVKRRYAKVLREDDVVDVGGYPEGDGYGSTVRVVRDGAVVGTFHFIPAEDDTYLQNSYSACDEFNAELNRA